MDTTIPSIESVKALDGRNFAMLSDEERRVLDFYRERGRKFGVSIAILSDADPVELSRAVSREHADSILAQANNHVSVTLA